jgi:hypothetical protein
MLDVINSNKNIDSSVNKSMVTNDTLMYPISKTSL